MNTDKAVANFAEKLCLNFRGLLIASILFLSSCSSNRNLTVADFINKLQQAGISVRQDSPIDCSSFRGCKKRHGLYLNSLEEWIEVYEFDTSENAKQAFRDGKYLVPITHDSVKVEFKRNLALFVYDKHSQWSDVWKVWQSL